MIDLIYLKYLKAKVSYEHDRRTETYPFAREAVREAVYNAIVHNCFMFGAPIQIRVEDEAMVVSNSCILPFRRGGLPPGKGCWGMQAIVASPPALPDKLPASLAGCEAVMVNPLTHR